MVLWIVAAAVLGLAFGSAFRERTVLPGYRWILLLLLRAGALCLLAASLLEFDLWSRWGAGGPPRVLAIIDASQSMQRRDGRDRDRFHRAVRDAEALRGRPDLQTVVVYARGDSLAAAGHPLGELTAIGTWIEKAQAGQWEAIVLFSDGNNNAGPDPVRAAAGYGRKIFCLGYGSGRGERTATIWDAWAPDRVEVGQEAEIRVRLETGRAPGLLAVESNNRRMATVKLEPDREAVQSIKYRASDPGRHRLSFYLLEGRDTVDQRSVSITAERSKIEILCIVGRPNCDLRFFKQAMLRDQGLEARYLSVSQGPGRIDSRAEDKTSDSDVWQKADLLVLLGPAGQRWPSDISSKIKESIEQKGRPIIFLGTAWGEGASTEGILPYLPLRARRNETLPARLKMEPEFWGRIVPWGIASAELSARFKKLPPLKTNRYWETTQSSVSVLAAVEDKDRTVPVWAWWYQGRSRILFMAVDDLWTWALGAAVLGGASGERDIYGLLWSGLIRWAVGRSGALADVEPERNIYYQGEEIRFQGRLAAGAGDRGEIKWRIALQGPGSFRTSQPMLPMAPGYYQSGFRGLPQGQYEWQSEISLGARVVDRSQGRFWVEPNRAEAMGQRQQGELLQKIAEVSGGGYWNREDDGTQNWLSGIVVDRPQRRSEKSLIFTGLVGLMLLLVEWFGRRRWGAK